MQAVIEHGDTLNNCGGNYMYTLSEWVPDVDCQHMVIPEAKFDQTDPCCLLSDTVSLLYSLYSNYHRFRYLGSAMLVFRSNQTRFLQYQRHLETLVINTRYHDLSGNNYQRIVSA